MNETRQEEVLREAAALVDQALREVGARCSGRTSTTTTARVHEPRPGARHSANFMRYTSAAPS
jgi:hypothetical protein